MSWKIKDQLAFTSTSDHSWESPIPLIVQVPEQFNGQVMPRHSTEAWVHCTSVHCFQFLDEFWMQAWHQPLSTKWQWCHGEESWWCKHGGVQSLHCSHHVLVQSAAWLLASQNWELCLIHDVGETTAVDNIQRRTQLSNWFRMWLFDVMLRCDSMTNRHFRWIFSDALFCYVFVCFFPSCFLFI